MNARLRASGLATVVVSALLTACGGGGGDAPPVVSAGGAPAPAPGAPAPAPGAPAPAPGAPAPAPSACPVSGGCSDSTLLLSPATFSVPARNALVNAVPSTTYAFDGPQQAAYQLINTYRGSMRGGGASGVGYLGQDAALDARAQSATTAGAPLPPGTARFDTTSGNPSGVLRNSDYCVKAIFASTDGAELLTAGTRTVGIATSTTPGICAISTSIADPGTWQLPRTTSAAVYPYPGKPDTLLTYFGALPGDVTFPAPAGSLGHPVFVSVASVEALPVDVPGAGTGTRIAPSAITLSSFTIAPNGGSPLPATAVVATGVNVGAGATGYTRTTNSFRYPTSMALVPSAPLAANTTYRVTMTGTVNGRAVSVNSSFSTGAF